MKFLALTYGKIFFAVVIFVTTIFFRFPLSVNVQCEPGEICPTFNKFVIVTELSNTPESSNVQYWIIVLELLTSYILAAAIITLTGVGGFVQFLAKK